MMRWAWLAMAAGLVPACGSDIRAVDGEALDTSVADSILDEVADVADVVDSVRDTGMPPTDTAGDTGDDGSTVPSSPDVSAGTRLKPRYEVTTFDDGAKSRVLIGWYDTLRKEDCTLMRATDGVLRCMPSTRFGSVYAVNFSDAACAVRFAAWGYDGGCASPPVYAEAGGAAGPLCEGGVRHAVSVVGAAITKPADTHQVISGVCTKVAVGFGADTKFYSAGPALPATTFVAAKVETVVP